MLKKLTSLLRKDHQGFDTFQIEVSTYSSLECQICPRAVFAEQWIFKNMSMDTFQKIAQYFERAKWVSLHGWGEPLENENCIAMLRLAKTKGCLTSLTSSGIHLPPDLCHRLVTLGLDRMVVALELATQGIQDSLSSGSDLRRTLESVEELIRIRKGLNRATPKITLSFPMIRLNMRELPGLLPMAAKMGADEVIFHNLDYLPDERWNILRAFHHESSTAAFQQSIDEIHRLSHELNIPTKTYPLEAAEQTVCELNPPMNVFLSVDGSIAPCPYLRIPKRGDIPRIFMNQECGVPQTSFGNINEEDFLAVWNKESYRKFRGIFEERKKAELNVAQLLNTFSNISSSDFEKATPKEPPSLPNLCLTCYKAYGI